MPKSQSIPEVKENILNMAHANMLNLQHMITRAVNEINERFPVVNNHIEEAEIREKVRNLLPIHGNMEIKEVKGCISRFSAKVIASDFDRCELSKFETEYNELNNETLRINSVKRDTESKEIMVKTYRCHHKTRYEFTRDTQRILKENPK